MVNARQKKITKNKSKRKYNKGSTRKNRNSSKIKGGSGAPTTPPPPPPPRRLTPTTPTPPPPPPTTRVAEEAAEDPEDADPRNPGLQLYPLPSYDEWLDKIKELIDIIDNKKTKTKGDLAHILMLSREVAIANGNIYEPWDTSTDAAAAGDWWSLQETRENLGWTDLETGEEEAGEEAVERGWDYLDKAFRMLPLKEQREMNEMVLIYEKEKGIEIERFKELPRQ